VIVFLLLISLFSRIKKSSMLLVFCENERIFGTMDGSLRPKVLFLEGLILGSKEKRKIRLAL